MQHFVAFKFELKIPMANVIMYSHSCSYVGVVQAKLLNFSAMNCTGMQKPEYTALSQLRNTSILIFGRIKPNYEI